MVQEETIKEFDLVRVKQLLTPVRPFHGTDSVSRAPLVGDFGTVVCVLGGQGDATMYIVECVDSNGMTVWLADFAFGELELLRDRT